MVTGHKPTKKALPIAIGNDAADHAAIHLHLVEVELEHVGEGPIVDTKVTDGKGMGLSELINEGRLLMTGNTLFRGFGQQLAASAVAHRVEVGAIREIERKKPSPDLT